MAEKIAFADGVWSVPDEPVIPYIEGDGTGIDITPAVLRIVDAAVGAAYDGRRRIHWKASAKTTKLMVKEYAAEEPQKLTVILDNLAPLDQGSWYQAGIY